MNESQLIRHIKAHIARGDKAKDKAEQHYIAAGQYLKQLKDDCPDQKVFLEKVEREIGIGKSRAYELIQIGDGRKTIEQVQDQTNVRKIKHRQSVRSGTDKDADDPEASAAAMKAAFADDDAQAKGTPRCTFCGRCPHHAEVLIVSSDGVHAICAGCVACVDMIRKRRERAAPLNGTPTTTKPPLTPALRSSPLRSGENADDPATSAEVMKAKFANDDRLDIPEWMLRKPKAAAAS
jgi:hypothetical protein